MGCNTSKETIPTKEEIDINVVEGNEDEVMKQVSNGETSNSAKTITINQTRPNSSCEKSSQAVSSSEKGVDSEPEKDLQEAAVKIQAAFRGHATRKSMKQADKPEPSDPSAEELANEFRSDDRELCHAATKIQASFRGHMARKKIVKDENGAEDKGDDPEELDIDLTDPELNKAATKIQASFRGHMSRKDDEAK